MITTEQLTEFLIVLNNSYFWVYSILTFFFILHNTSKEERLASKENKKNRIARGLYSNKLSTPSIILLILYIVSIHYYFNL